MRARIMVLLLGLVVSLVLALGVPLALALAARQTENVLVDRRNDTERFAALAAQAVGDADRPWLASELSRYDEVYGISAVVLDRGGPVRAASRTAVPDLAADPAVRTALAGRRDELSRWVLPWQREPLVVAVPVVRAGDVVGAAVTVSPTDALRDRVAWLWAAVGAGEIVAVLLCVLVASRLARWVLRPVHRLDTAAHEIARGRFDARVADGGGPPELRRLTGSFNTMADAVQTSWQRQRRFVADASHQLRNPLNALLLRQEVLGMDLPAEHQADFDHARAEGRRLAQVLDELLALATAEETASPPQELSLAAVVDERLGVWRATAAAREIELRRRGTDVVGIADATALGSALDAIIDNAIKFSPEGSVVRVDIDTAEQEAVVRVTDKGSGLPQADLVRAGDRFWRSPQHENLPGSGLGLSITKTLLASFGGHLEISSGDRGLAVSLHVPRPD
jgi:signal transduction histidine kinase